ncbi:serine/threonine-protein kinase WAG1-like [Zingiber officinale]|uniref:non-specific serine/threonine protein kinase n=1 Tax=Zingiber officinale TaxID=94328 RepID=A0A8J5KRZ7_ZINOF|nr:serine/threonine-protein kinase WAG1-like [Zingiber officinale]KAG6490202.1 hypothetical protein ZIOFF_051487 [Zingiber officinale]
MDHEERLSFFPPDSYSDLDSSFTSSTTSASTFSARSSLSLPSFSNSTTSSSFALNPLPHSRSDNHWSALRAAANLSPDGRLHLHHLRLLRPLGSGHLARVFHCRLHGFDDDHHSPAEFALKVIDLDALNRDIAKPVVPIDDDDDDESSGGKMWHVRSEALALAEMDHPFLPTLYARLDASHYACFLIDYCPGGDLHSLLRRRRGHRLPVSAARFYAAEVLIALEYLHALGFVYRDLKPENVLLRADGHVMLSDFDLSFRSHVSPALFCRHRRRNSRPRGRFFCCGGSAPASCEFDEEELEFVAEPSSAFSKACVGTHEYLAPEVACGSGHGAAVDWWAFGVFLYELLYGRTPFKGATKEATLRNILTQDVKFPESEDGEGGKMAKARDLITQLLERDSAARMGSIHGAAEIKRHPFFQSIRWPLIRCARPPVVAGLVAGGSQRRPATTDQRVLPNWWNGWRKSATAYTITDEKNNRKKKGIKVRLGFGLGLGLGSKRKLWQEKHGGGR